MSYPNSLCGGGGLDGGVSEQTTSLLSASANRQRKSVIFVEVRGDLRARKGVGNGEVVCRCPRLAEPPQLQCMLHLSLGY